MPGAALHPGDDVEVRLCRNAGAICLQGGCVYCNEGLAKDHVWRTPKLWRRYAGRKGLTKDFEIGWAYGWPNNARRLTRGKTHG